MSPGPSIVSLTDVGKRFVKYEDRPTLVEGFGNILRRTRRGRLWAVRHVDLEVEAGDAVGVIGRNGSGKSTMLSMLAGVTAPTEGVVRVRGRIAPLLSLGVGFDQELTGRENVYINATILGMSRREIDERLGQIIAFSELADFIDTPVKFYSSGMLVRLGFAVAISADPQILIVDEVLSVGDVGFQQRSFNRMMELQKQGTTILVVSHNMSAIQRLATRTVVLHEGSVRFVGPTSEAISIYYDLLKIDDVENKSGNAPAAGPVTLSPLELLTSDGKDTSFVESQDTVTFRTRLRIGKDVENPVFWFAIRDDMDTLVLAERCTDLGTYETKAGAEFVLTMRLPLRLVAGTYTAGGGLAWGTSAKEAQYTGKKTFYVAGRPMIRGIVDLAPVIGIEADGSPPPDASS